MINPQNHFWFCFHRTGNFVFKEFLESPLTEWNLALPNT